MARIVIETKPTGKDKVALKALELALRAIGMDTYVAGVREDKLKVVLSGGSSLRAVETVRGVLEEFIGVEVDETMFGEARQKRVERVAALVGRSSEVNVHGIIGTITVRRGEMGALFVEFQATDLAAIDAERADDGRCVVRLDPDGHAWFPPIDSKMREWLCTKIGEPHQIIDAMADEMEK